MDEYSEIYVLRGASGAMKIGVAASAKKRLRAIENTAGQKCELEYSRSIPTALRRSIESHAHWILRSAWLRGEWFNVDAAAAKAAVDESVLAVAEGRSERSNRNLGRPRINGENTMARFADGTLARIKSALSEDEKQSDFIRKAVERELERRGK